MNDQKLWWSEVEERFKEKFDYLNNDYGVDLLVILAHFHKEIQEHLHEESVDSLELENATIQAVECAHKRGYDMKRQEICKNCMDLDVGSIIKVNKDHKCIFCNRQVGSIACG